MKYFYTVLIGLVALSSFPSVSRTATSSEPSYSEAFQSCIKRSGQTDPAIGACESGEFGRQDAALNAVYKKLNAKLDPARKVSLQKAERAWVQFRDAQCAYESSADASASLGPIIMQKCRMRLTYNRVQELEQMLDLESF
jgi:uncharacterized protein YecT (DUF1311 family)